MNHESTKERPILFSAPMVRAILAGTKTQTRRVLKDAIWNGFEGTSRVRLADDDHIGSGLKNDFDDGYISCSYGQPGDRLWVRESVRAADLDDFSRAVEYLADGACVQVASAEDIESEAFGRWEKLNSYRSNDAALDGGKTVQPMHMPRWASRIDLEVTGVRVERLNAISEADASAEGVYSVQCNDLGTEVPYYRSLSPPCDLFKMLWESINGAGSWDANPWVWVVEFKRVKP